MALDAALALVVDRSGSMYSIANDVRGSVKQFIGDQKKMEGKASLKVAQFDHTYQVIYDVNDINEVDEETFAKAYSPRGSTALLDAIGRTVFEMKEKLDKMAIEERPKRVVIAVITDGEENASREYQLDQIKKMIQENEALGWDFLFLGASLNAISVAQSMGFSGDKSSVYETGNISTCMGNLSAKFSQARKDEDIKFTQEERDAFVNTQQTPPAA
jgi:Mg-chelatase subunit ChlD